MKKNNFKAVFLLFVITSSLIFNIKAQTGPGGIGNNSGAGNLKLWLRGDSVSIDVGVDTLFDLSGYNNHFEQSNTSYQPAVTTLNGFNVVDFDGSGDFLLDDDGENYINGQSAFTFLFVLKSDNASTDKGFFIADEPVGSNDTLSFRYEITGANGGQSNVISVRTGASTGLESSSNSQSASSQLLTFAWLSNTTPELFIDGAQDVLSYGDLIIGTLNGSDKVILGKGSEDTGAGDGWDGVIAEVIFFNNHLNSAERTIVENYLSTRYNLVISNDEYTPADAGYIHDVVGIGHESDGEHNGSVSSGFGINEDNSTLDTDGEYIFVSHDNRINNIASIKTDAEVITNLGAGAAAWNRNWYLKKSVGANVDLKIYFDFGDGINGGIPQNIANYRLINRAGTSGNYSEVTTTNIGIQSGDQVYFEVSASEILDGYYYTLGTVDQINSPVEGSSAQTWYTLVSGDWDDHQIWTLDPSGALPDNLGNEIPDANDNVVIISGKTVTAKANNYILNSIDVDGRLYLGSTNGHDFNNISGNGRIYIEGDYFPAGDSTSFISKGLDEGTVVYSGDTTINLAVARTFYNMEVIMDNATDTVYLMSDYILNGNLKIEKGILKINNDNPASTSLLTLDIEGDINVYTEGSLKVGTADAYSDNSGGAYGDYHEGFHQIIINGDFKNQGIVRLTNLSVPNYNVSNMATDLNGAVSLVFTGAANNNFTCENTTDLYNLVINKGTSQTYQLEIYAEDTSHFALFGDNNNGWNYGATAEENANPETQKSLWIKAGTLKLTGEIFIPSLTEGSRDYTIGKKARLLLAGPNAFVSNTANELSTYIGLSHGSPDGVSNAQGSQGLYLLGKLQIDNGKFLLGEAEAINFRDEAAGVINVNGGELEANQIAISSSATRGDFSYVQTGGIVKLTSQYTADSDNALLHLNNSDMVFIMSGGEIKIEGIAPTDPATETNGILIASAEGNYSVTGGTVTIDYTGASNVEVNSTANFHNFLVKQNTDVLCERALEIFNDLTIENGADLNTAGLALSIGGDFNFNNGASYSHGNNTTMFIGETNSDINIGDATSTAPLILYNLEVNKDQQSNPSLFWDLEVLSSGRAIGTVPLRITNDLVLTRGEFNSYQFEIEMYGDTIEILDGNITANTINPGWITLTGVSASTHTLKGAYGKTQSFGHIEIDDVQGATLLSDIDATKITFTTGQFYLQSYNLEVTDGIINGAGSSNYFHTLGNSSDGGLTIHFTLSGLENGIVASFPIGSPAGYTPGELLINNYNFGTDISGWVQVNPVNDYHPATRTPSNVLPYYWISEQDGFETVPDNVAYYRFYYINNIVNNFREHVLYNNVWIDAVSGQPGNLLEYDEPTFGFINGEFACGQNSEFNRPRLLYSRKNGDWFDISANPMWEEDDGTLITQTNRLPRRMDIAVIRNGHRVNATSGNIDVAELEFEHDTTVSTDFEDLPRLQINGNYTFNFEKVTGTGMFTQWIGTTNNPTVTGDFGDFANRKYSWYLFVAENDYINLPTNQVVFPNLATEVNSYGWHLTFTDDIVVNYNLNPRGRSILLLNNGANGDIYVGGNVYIGDWEQGKIQFPSTGTERTLTVLGSIDFTKATSAPSNWREIFVDNSTPSSLDHLILVGDSIIQGLGILDLYNGGGTANNAIVRFIGDNNSGLRRSGSEVSEFYRIEMQKSIGKSFTFHSDFTLNGPSNSYPKALELKSGDFKIETGNVDITLSSGGADFKIPSKSSLFVQGEIGNNAIVRVSGNNTGINLDSDFTLSSYGHAYINGGANNYIEYSASGNAKIDIYNGELHVGSQIRRSLYTTDGILKFNQLHKNSIVVLGENDAPQGDRGIFEIANIGSEFTQVDSANITIVRQQTNSTIAALYLDPETASLGSGAVFTFGDNTNTPANQIIGINSSINLKNLIINSTSDPTVQMQIQELTLEEDLIINSGDTLDANGLDLNIQGDFFNYGTFEPNGNTTIFNGSLDQKITGKTSFYNLHKTSSNALSLCETLTDTIYIENNFRIEDGIFRDSSNAVSIKGDLLNNGTHIYGGTGNGLEMLGLVVQDITGNGSGVFGKLTISNASGVGVQVDIGNKIYISDGLNLNGGVLDVGDNLLDLSVDAQIIEGTTFSNNNMIRTNISFTDNGVRKTFPSTADAGGAYSYIIPIGSGEKYTPVEYKISSNGNSTGKIITKAADEAHPSVIEDSETPEIVDQDNVLQYHWVVKSDGITGFTADVEMQYYSADIYITSPYTVADYLTARLLNDGSGSWNKFTTDDFDEANNLCHFNFINVGDEEIEGDYTAGIDDAIPNQVPFYETNKSGSWTDGNIWTPFVAGGPRGAMVRINTNDTVSMPSNFQSSYTTTINGRLEVDSTFGHRLGEVDGFGTLYAKRASLPAAYYEDFFAVTGGTLEYGGSASYDILAGFTQINNLKLSGTGERRFPNQDVTLLGDLIIEGDDATLNLINDHDQKISVGGDIFFNTGSFDAGDGDNAILEINGTSPQTINGKFTFPNDFYHFEMNNSAGVSLTDSIDIYGNLSFTSGIITVPSTKALSLTQNSSAVSGYGLLNFVDGTMRKKMASGSSFIFPVGDVSRLGKVELINTLTSGSQFWETQYYNANPHSASLDTNVHEASLEMISGNEYWRVKSINTDSSHVKIRWDNQSQLPAMSTDADREANLKIVEWSGTQWEVVGSDVTDNSVNDGNIQTDNRVGLEEHYFTIGTEESAPLATATFTSNDTSICDDGSASLVVVLTGTSNWEIDVSIDGGAPSTYTASSSPYTLTPAVSAAGTYSLTAVRENNGTTPGTVFGSDVVLTVITKPTAYNITPGGGNASYCSGGVGIVIGLDNSDTGVNYDLYIDGSPAGSTVAGSTGSAVSFGNQTVAGLYEVYASDASDVADACAVLMTGNLTLSVDPLPTATITVNATLDSICTGDNTQIEIDFTTGATPWDLVIDDGTNPTENINNVGDPYTYTPNVAPIWIDDGSPDTDYVYSIQITDNNSCVNTLNSPTVTVFKIPETGSQYHISNDWGN